MGEFIGRWVLSGLVCALLLAATGGRAGDWWGWVVAGLWFGFCNASLRPLVLRMGVGDRGVLVVLLGGLALVNGVLFLSVDWWLPLAGVANRGRLTLAALVAMVVSWGLSSRFRAHDGRWHWITHHGSVIRS
jgi:hypothetical protein